MADPALAAWRSSRSTATETVLPYVRPRLERSWRQAKPRLVRLADRVQPRLEYYLREVILPRMDNEAVVGLVAVASSELVNRELEARLSALPPPVAAEAKVLVDRTQGNLQEKVTSLAENEWDVATLLSSELETLASRGVTVDADTEAAVRRIIELQINQAIASLTSGAQLTMISQLNETIQGITDSAAAVVGGYQRQIRDLAQLLEDREEEESAFGGGGGGGAGGVAGPPLGGGQQKQFIVSFDEVYSSLLEASGAVVGAESGGGGSSEEGSLPGFPFENGLPAAAGRGRGGGAEGTVGAAASEAPPDSSSSSSSSPPVYPTVALQGSINDYLTEFERKNEALLKSPQLSFQQLYSVFADGPEAAFSPGGANVPPEVLQLNELLLNTTSMATNSTFREAALAELWNVAVTPITEAYQSIAAAEMAPNLAAPDFLSSFGTQEDAPSPPPPPPLSRSAAVRSVATGVVDGASDALSFLGSVVGSTVAKGYGKVVSSEGAELLSDLRAGSGSDPEAKADGRRGHGGDGAASGEVFVVGVADGDAAGDTPSNSNAA